MTLAEIIKIHKENKALGFSSDVPACILSLWYKYHLYLQKDFILFEYVDYVDKLETLGFLLFDLVKNEIVVLAVDKRYQRYGIGTKLISRLPPREKIIVIHDNDTNEFYLKNGFEIISRVNLTQNLSVRYPGK